MRRPVLLSPGHAQTPDASWRMQKKSSGDDAQFGGGDDPEDALPSDYMQFSRLIGEAPSEAEQRLSRKQRMSLGKPPDAEASVYLQK